MPLNVYYTPNGSIIGTNFFILLSSVFQKVGLGEGQTKEKRKKVYGTYKDPLLI
jgi:hypothetical protein